MADRCPQGLCAMASGGDDLAATCQSLLDQLTQTQAELHQVGARAHEARALLQRMVKYVREDEATTPGTTRLERLTSQVADYLQRTHDPMSILRDSASGFSEAPRLSEHDQETRPGSEGNAAQASDGCGPSEATRREANRLPGADGGGGAASESDRRRCPGRGGGDASAAESLAPELALTQAQVEIAALREVVEAAVPLRGWALIHVESARRMLDAFDAARAKLKETT